MEKISTELLLEIFQFCDRNSLEKLQLVCLKWNVIVRENEARFSLHQLGTGYFKTSDRGLYVHINHGLEFLRPDAAPLLKKSIFETINISEADEIQSIIEILYSFVQITNRKIKTKKIYLCYHAVNANQLSNLINCIPTLFNKLIEANEVHFLFDENGILHFISNVDRWYCNNFPKFIILRQDEKEYRSNLERMIFILIIELLTS